jgi:hypothetical protein
MTAIDFEEPCYFRVQSWGAVTVGEMERFIEALAGDPRLAHANACLLVDAREVSDLPSASELRGVAESMGRLVERGLGPMAIVADKAFVYGVARMFATYAEGVSLRVHPFRCIEEARSWLETAC